MRVWIVRHSQAVASDSVDDAVRPLTAEGERQAAAIAEFLGPRGAPDAIWSSPLVRARRTAEPIARKFPVVQIRETESLASEGDASKIVAELERSGMDEIILVSHEPLTGDLAAQLIAGTARAGSMRFTPGTVALFESVRKPLAGAMTLRLLLTPESLERKAT